MSYATPPCPAAASHGRLLDLVTARASYYCPARAHEDDGTSPWFDIDLVPVPRREPVSRPPAPAHTPRRGRGRREGGG